MRRAPIRVRLTAWYVLVLAVVPTRCCSHHGRIYVTNREGGGSAFVVSLPVSPDEN